RALAARAVRQHHVRAGQLIVAASHHKLDAAPAISLVQQSVGGLPVYIAGSAAAIAGHQHLDQTAYDDVDVFTSTPQALMAAAERLLRDGFELDDRFSRVYVRWIKYGFKGWHTNSLKLYKATPTYRVEVNLVYKLMDGHPTTSLAQVLESFDFG